MNTENGLIYNTREDALISGVNARNLMMIRPTNKQRRIMKVGRNDLCPCGSGMKFKKCHLGKPADWSPVSGTATP